MKTPDLAVQLSFCNVPVFPCNINSVPALEGGFKNASTTLGDYWPSSKIGVTIPPGLFVIDVDLYKGISTDKINSMLNCELDWNKSLLQHTPSGGTHHAFRVPIDSDMKQGSDLFHTEIGKGFDTRVSGKGYICSGELYNQAGDLGILNLSIPDNLPELPIAALKILAKQAITQTSPSPVPLEQRDAGEVQKMLDVLDADCSRTEWFNVASGLKNYYSKDDATGWLLFNNWSMTATDQGKYSEHEARKLWNTIKPVREDGVKPITIATVADMAIKQGYLPTRNAYEVFGKGENVITANIPLIEELVRKINEIGGAPENVGQLTDEIRCFPCNDIQRAVLTATLQRVLRNSDIKITEKELRAATSPNNTSVRLPNLQLPENNCTFTDLKISPAQGLSNVHNENALLLIQTIFTNRMARFQSDIHWWNGAYWEMVNKMDLASKVSWAFVNTGFGKDSNITGTIKQLTSLVPAYNRTTFGDGRVFFKNGVFDPGNPQDGLIPHDITNFNTSTLQVDYNPSTPTPDNWAAFMHSCFHAEMERVDLLQEIMGWWLVSSSLGHQKAVAFDGVTRSGKGTILYTMSLILGQAMTDISLSQLADNKALSGLRSAILGVDRDAKRPNQRDLTTVHSNFNKITANEPISIPLLWAQQTWNGELNCKLAIACNGIPLMVDDSGAAPNRWIVLKFTESMLGKEDLTLSKRLAKESASIAMWALKGLERLVSNGKFTLPASSIEESNALVDSSSPLVQFVDECLDISDEYKTHTSTLWNAYRSWCSDTNSRLPSQNQFTRALTATLQSQGVSRTRALKLGGMVKPGFKGVQLKIHTSTGVTPINNKATQVFK